MRKLLVCIRYNGTNYHGWQVQDNAISVQETIQDAIEKLTGVREGVSGCSRTDSGVHANSYYFHMYTQSSIPEKGFFRALNKYLPKDIAVLSVKEIEDDFHARYSAIGKEYVYKIWNKQERNPFLQNMAWHYNRGIDLNLINEALPYIIGKHDFSSFCAMGAKPGDKTRTIYESDVKLKDGLLEFRFYGDGFLYNMVRILVGTMIFVSEKKIKPCDLPYIIEAKDRSEAGKTSPAHGLYLNKVVYNQEAVGV